MRPLLICFSGQGPISLAKLTAMSSEWGISYISTNNWKILIKQFSSLNTHSIHGPVVNPYASASKSTWVDHERRSAGGSSGGSAAAVAEGMCDA